MAALTTALSILGILVRMVNEIREGVADGVSDDEIRARLADPNGVGQEILNQVRARKDKFDSPFEADDAG